MGLASRRFYALTWKDYVVHKRHYVWTLLEVTIPVLVCAMAILSNSHQGKPRLEDEKTFELDDFERIYGELNSQKHTLLVAPNSSFTRALIAQIDDRAVQIKLCETETELAAKIEREIPRALDQLMYLIPDPTRNETIGGVVINSDSSLAPKSPTNQNSVKQSEYVQVLSKLDGKPMQIPLHLDLSIRAKNFRLGPEPFPKKYSLGPFIHSDHYTTSFFTASQLMLSRAYLNLLATHATELAAAAGNGSPSGPAQARIIVPGNEDIVAQRMPYPKHVAHRRLRESTLGTYVVGSQKQKPFVLTMDYCITAGFLVTAIFLAKRIVDEKKSRVRDMLRLVGISDWTYYASHAFNTMLIMLLQVSLITLLFTGHPEAPAQHIEPSLMLAILVLYCLSALLFVQLLSTLFSSSTKAIIFTSLVWLGLPEIIDRIFKLNAGVAESNGFLVVDERWHLAFCLLPNFGLRLMNRLLTECDIYGEFFAKQNQYGEYRAIWANIFHVLPLYKTITIGHIMLTSIGSIPLYALLIYLSNKLMAANTSLASISSGSEGNSTSNSSSLPRMAIRLITSPLVAPFKVLRSLFASSGNNRETTSRYAHSNGAGEDHLSHFRQQNLLSMTSGTSLPGSKGYLNNGFSNSLSTHLNQEPAKIELNMLSKDRGADHQAKDQSMSSGLNQGLDNEELNLEEQKRLEHYFEPAAKMLRVGVSIRDLSKTYLAKVAVPGEAQLRRIEAVKRVSLDMYYSQILVLLGHNGAGKTTLIDIISGHNHKTSGSVHIDGHSIDTHPAEARRQLGFCPQFDVLFQQLTVEEHLYFYGLVKGSQGRQLNEEIEQLLLQSGLDKHRQKLSKALSGGYKRKLSLAIAMVARSRILILDEPTSGMDPESRRKVWDFLQLIRHERLIMMTTHHMDEADALGDRIAVMSGGQVKCAGSALFLKRLFNAGYHLRISKSPASWSQIAFDELVGAKFNLDDQLENATPHELMYKFDADQTTKLLPALFDQLERVKKRVGIFGFGVTVSTMDDVFMKIGVHFDELEAREMEGKLKQDLRALSGSGTLEHNKLKLENLQKPNGDSKLDSSLSQSERLYNCRKLEGDDLFKQQVRALLIKRYRHARTNWFQLVWILGVSIACIVSIVALIEFVIYREKLLPPWEREMSLPGAGYGFDTDAIYQLATEPPPTATEAAAEIESLREAAFPGTNPSSTSTSTSSITTATPSTTSTMELEVATSTTSSPTTTATSSQRRRRRRLRRQTLSTGSGDLVEGSPTPSSLNDSALFLDNYWLEEAIKGGIKPGHLLTYTDVNSQMIDLLTRQFADFREHYVIGGEKAPNNRYVAWYSGEATHALPISLNIMLNSILHQLTDLIIPSSSSSSAMGNQTSLASPKMNSANNQQQPRSFRITLRHIAMAQFNTLVAFLPMLGRLINVVFLPFSLAFVTSYFVIFPTHERVSKCKHLQIMTGVSLRTYWLSHFLFDLALYACYTFMVLLVYFTWDRVLFEHRIYFANFEHSLALIALASLFILGALPLAYTFSFVAKKPTSAFSSFCVLTILTGTATLTLVSLYELKYERTASAPLQVAFTVFLVLARLIPSVSLLVGLQKLFALNTTRAICINMSQELLDLLCRYHNSPIVDEELKMLRPERCCRHICGNECHNQWPFNWTSWFGINVELAYLLLDAVLFWSILVLIESPRLRKKLSNVLCRLNPMSGSEGSRWIPLAGRLFKPRTTKWEVPQSSAHPISGKAKLLSQQQQQSQLQVANKPSVCPSGAKSIESEQERVRQTVATREWGHHSLVVSELAKTYRHNHFRAVDGLGFLVERHEFFGLLGVNGAGKSSTFKMLTGEMRPTSGRAWAGSSELASGRQAYMRRIGYCPQQDALISSLTGLEMLELFARLRGLPEQMCSEAARHMLTRLGLSRIGHLDCHAYSGGNKRRLSVAMSLIGAPELVFLDEPTSGVDPRSRRRLWSTLIEFQRETGSSIVMTSHSMNECECLCDRVAIMVAGQFRVMGSVQYLRTRLSRGFSLVLKLRADSLANSSQLSEQSQLIHNYMEREFACLGRLHLKELHQTIMQYHLDPSSSSTQSEEVEQQSPGQGDQSSEVAPTLAWSTVLNKLEQAKNDLQLEDYQITSDASLESIFLSLAKQQDEAGKYSGEINKQPETNRAPQLLSANSPVAGYNERAFV